MSQARRKLRTQRINPFQPKPVSSSRSNDSLFKPKRYGKRRKFSDEDNETFPKLQRSRSENNNDNVLYEKYSEDKRSLQDVRSSESKETANNLNNQLEDNKVLDENYPEDKRSLQDVRSCATKETANNLTNQLDCQERRGQKRRVSEANSSEFETFDYKRETIPRPKSKPCEDQKKSMQPISTKKTRRGRKRRVSSVHTGFLRKIHEEYNEPPSQKMRLIFPNATIRDAPRRYLSTHGNKNKRKQQRAHTKQFTPMILEIPDSFASIPELTKFKCLSISSSSNLLDYIHQGQWSTLSTGADSLGVQILFANQGYRTSSEPSIIPSMEDVSADPSTDVDQ